MSTHEDARDWDAWVDSRIPEHVEGIMERIRNSPEAVAWREARQAAARARIAIDPETGNMPIGLCWVCASHEVEPATRTTPTFRACYVCRVYDMKQARRLGMKMVLPLMEYPTPPVLPGQRYPTDPKVVAALGKAWSQVSVLNEWRASVVRAVLALRAWPEGEAITLDEFAETMPWTSRRCRMAWWAYVDRHQPELASVLDALPGPESRRR